MPQFVKSHGLGNDYLVIDPANVPFQLNEVNIRLICHRHLGVGSDGILAVAEPGAGDYGVRIFNPDGSEAEKSGNGVRIFAKYLRDYGRALSDRFTIQTLGGLVEVILERAEGRVNIVTANMGAASFHGPEEIEVEGERFAVSSVSVGNPHCVILVPDVDQVDLLRLGPRIEHHPAYPQRTNVQFAQVLSRDTVKIRIWERGAGETLASGSSSCAVAAACHRLGLVDSEVSVSMPGGRLQIRVDDSGQLWMRGPVEEVCRGDFGSELLARLRPGAGAPPT